MSCETGVRLKTAQDKVPAGIDEDLGIPVQREVPKGGLQNLLPNSVPQGRQFHVLLMLAGDHHRGHPLGLAIFIFHGHLGFAVRAQTGDGSGAPGLGQSPGNAVGQHHRQGQKLQGVTAGIAIDDSLIASTSSLQSPLLFGLP